MVKSYPSNEEILKGVRSSDASVLSFIINNIFPKVSAYLSKKGAQIHESEDIMMVSLEALYLKVQTVEIILDKATFESYFTRICLNQWYKIIRRKNIHNRVTNELTKVSKEIGLDEYQLKIERYKLYEEKMNELGELCQQILNWFIYKKMSSREVAQRLNLKEGAVRKKKFDCKQRLIGMIQNDPLYKELKQL